VILLSSLFRERLKTSSSLGVTTSYLESFSLLNDISPFTMVLDVDCPILNLHFTDVFVLRHVFIKFDCLNVEAYFCATFSFMWSVQTSGCVVFVDFVV
jgi:hypothetical protein